MLRHQTAEDPANAVPSLVRGGPVWELERRLRLLAADGLPTWAGAASVALFCWLPMAVLAAFDPRNWSLQYDHSFFADLDVYARFLVAIFILLITDRTTDQRLHKLLVAFEDTGIVNRRMHADYFAYIRRGDERTSSSLAEAIMLLLCVPLTVLSTYLIQQSNLEHWVMAAPGSTGLLSPAGWWKTVVGMPLFLLLAMRWLWRLVAWTMLMRDITRLPLQLVATHPDKAGGLGFLTLFPAMFLPLVFSLSVVFAAGIMQLILIQDGKVVDLELAVAGWLALILILFVGPLGVFVPQLLDLKEKALVDYGALVAHYNRMAEQQIRDDYVAGKPVNTDNIAILADISAGLDTIKSLKPIPIEFFALLPLIISALLPLLAAAAVKFPIGSLLWSLFTSVI